MGWLSNLISKFSETISEKRYAEVMNGYSPIFSQFGTDIYASDVVQQAIGCIVSEVKKLQIEHIREVSSDYMTINDDLSRVLKRPNQLMTMSDFLEKITWLLFLNYNVFIIPTYYEWKDKKTGKTRKKYDGLYPIQPSQVEFIEDPSNNLYVKFRFTNGTEYTLNYRDIIHIKKNYSVNQYMGGNEQGQPDNGPLLKTLNLNHQLLQGIAKAMNASYTVSGVVKFNQMLDGGKTEAALKELEKKLQRSESGFLPLDIKADFMPLKKDVKLIDGKTLEFIDSKIIRNYGTSLAILTGDFTKEQYAAFYQKAIEPIVISYGQGFEKTLISDNQFGRGNRIKLFPAELIFMSTDQTLEMIRLLGDSGTLYENEKRVALGKKPLKELEGIRMQSLNYINSDLAAEYQVTNKNKAGGNEDGQEGSGDA